MTGNLWPGLRSLLDVGLYSFSFVCFVLEQITVSVLFERTFILGSDAREMTEEACLLFFLREVVGFISQPVSLKCFCLV